MTRKKDDFCQWAREQMLAGVNGTHFFNYHYGDTRPPHDDSIVDNLRRDYASLGMHEFSIVLDEVVDDNQELALPSADVHCIDPLLHLRLIHGQEGGIDWVIGDNISEWAYFSSEIEAECAAALMNDHLRSITERLGIRFSGDMPFGCLTSRPADRFRGYYEGRVSVPMLQLPDGGFMYALTAVPLILGRFPLDPDEVPVLHFDDV